MGLEDRHSLAARVEAGDLRALARAATLIEAQGEAGRKLLEALFGKTGRARVIGITGPAGAGKSTLVDQLAKALRSDGRTVGIIAIDPSSPFSRGSLLGDRIRMGDHHADPGVFIRSMATRGRMGGVAHATLEIALLMDAAGRDWVLIETTGVGQDEVEIARLADLTVVVLTPGFGDDVQAIKAGLLEIADVYAINKSDLPGAAQLENDLRAMQSFGTEEERARAAPVRRVAATRGEGVRELLATIEELWTGRGKEIWTHRLREMLQERLAASLPDEAIEQEAAQVAEKIKSPYAAVDALYGRVIRHGN